MKSMRGKKKPPGLMLTSLLDMFTIILIFLIVSFEAEETSGARRARPRRFAQDPARGSSAAVRRLRGAGSAPRGTDRRERSSSIPPLTPIT